VSVGAFIVGLLVLILGLIVADLIRMDREVQRRYEWLSRRYRIEEFNRLKQRLKSKRKQRRRG
jgi:membrane protein required for beta-lactamase induction